MAYTLTTMPRVRLTQSCVASTRSNRHRLEEGRALQCYEAHARLGHVTLRKSGGHPCALSHLSPKCITLYGPPFPGSTLRLKTLLTGATTATETYRKSKTLGVLRDPPAHVSSSSSPRATDTRKTHALDYLRFICGSATSVLCQITIFS